MANTAYDVITIAKSYVGKVKGRPNQFTRWYGLTGAWCAMFVSYCGEAAGCPKSVFPKYAAVADYLNYAKEIGRFKAKGEYIPQYGDVMIQKSDGASHVGFVIEGGPDSFTTVEGNSSDAVKQNTRYYNSKLTGFYVPVYNDINHQGGNSSFNTSLNLKTWDDIISADLLDKHFKGALCGTGELFIKYSIAYQVNPALMAAIAMHESGNGLSAAANDSRHNCFGYMSGGSIKTFSSLGECIKTSISNLSRNYINKGLKTISAISKKYAPIGASNDPSNLNKYWVSGVSTYYTLITEGRNADDDDFGTGVPDEQTAQNNLTGIYTGSASGGQDSGSGEKKKEITKVVLKSLSGKDGYARSNPMENLSESGPEPKIFIINHSGEIVEPVVIGDITWETFRKENPTKLTFSVLKDGYLNFAEGAQVIFRVENQSVFYGFVFSKNRDKDKNKIECTAYDQLRYLKNKATYIYSDKTATEIIKMLADDFKLTCGEMEDTEYRIPKRMEDDQTLLDVVQNALDLTVIATGQMYCLWDDYGKLRLSNVKNRIYNYVLDNETARLFDYQTTIDDNVYNKISLYYDNEETGERELYVTQNGEKITEWGVLQYTENLEDPTKADKVLALYSMLYGQKRRKLSVSKAIGNIDIRGGCSIYVDLDLGDVIQQGFMLCEKVSHTFSSNIHTMDLTLSGGMISYDG